MMTEPARQGMADRELIYKNSWASGGAVANFTVPGLNGDRDGIYEIEYDFYLANLATSRVNILINGTVTTDITTVSLWHGYWSGSLTGPQTEANGTFTLIRAEGTGWHSGTAILKARSGKVRTMRSEYGIRDTTLGYSDRVSRASWDDTSTNITSLKFEKTGTTATLYGNIRIYRVNE